MNVLLLISLLFALLMLGIFFREKFLLSPTAIFMAYGALALPISYCVSFWLSIGSVFYVEPKMISQTAVLEAYFALGLGIIFFIIARQLTQRVALRKCAPRALLRQRFIPLTVLAVLLAVISAADLISELGGISRIIDELGAVRSGELVGKGVQVYAITMLLPTVLQWHLVSVIRQNRPHAARFFWLCVLSSLAGATFGFRAPAIALIIQTVTIWYLLKRTPSKRTLVIAVSLFVPVVTLAGFARFFANDAAVQALEQADLKTVAGLLANTTITRVRGIETFSLMTQHVDARGFHWFGGNIVESMLSVVPSFVVEKPVSVTETIATQVYGGFLFDAGILKDVYGGVSYTFIAEGYWNAGLAGVAIYGAILGLLFAFTQRAERTKTPTNLQIILYKATAGFCPLLVEATQLGANAIIMNVAINAMIVAFLTLRTSTRATPGACRAAVGL